MESLELSLHQLEAIRHHAVAAYPEECCGILVGVEDRVEEVIATDNAAEDPRRSFDIGARQLLAAHQRARAQGRQVVGYYHSHPDGAARPSPLDRRRAWAGPSYLIVRVTGCGAEAVRGWRLTASGDFHEKPLRVSA